MRLFKSVFIVFIFGLLFAFATPFALATQMSGTTYSMSGQPTTVSQQLSGAQYTTNSIGNPIVFQNVSGVSFTVSPPLPSATATSTSTLGSVSSGFVFPSCALKATSLTTNAGQATTISWALLNADKIFILGQNLSALQTITVFPEVTTTYLASVGNFITKQCSITVEVVAQDISKKPLIPNVPSSEVINKTTQLENITENISANVSANTNNNVNTGTNINATIKGENNNEVNNQQTEDLSQLKVDCFNPDGSRCRNNNMPWDSFAIVMASFLLIGLVFGILGKSRK